MTALLIKEQGDYPAFWHQAASLIATVEVVYERVRTKSERMG